MHARDFIRAEFDSRHPIFSSQVWTSGLIDELADKVHVGILENKISKLSATGVPPYHILANEISHLSNRISSLEANVVEQFEQLPDRLKLSLLENFQIDGTVPITHAQISEMISNLENSLRNLINDNNVSTSQIMTRNVDDPSTNASIENWTWAGRIHPVPENFRFPM